MAMPVEYLGINPINQALNRIYLHEYDLPGLIGGMTE